MGDDLLAFASEAEALDAVIESAHDEYRERARETLEAAQSVETASSVDDAPSETEIEALALADIRRHRERAARLAMRARELAASGGAIVCWQRYLWSGR